MVNRKHDEKNIVFNLKVLFLKMSVLALIEAASFYGGVRHKRYSG
ncbi:hypothetical protein [Flavobacterium limi]|nr:hypothetical protein [Flavobacterium limi]